jgi:hypothetical protein
MARLLALLLSASAAVAFRAAGGAPRARTVVRSAAVDELRAMKVADLRQALGERGISWASYIEKEEVRPALPAPGAPEILFYSS